MKRRADVHAEVHGPGQNEPASVRTVLHLDSSQEEDVERESFALDFALSYLQRTAYGTRSLHLSGGDTIEVPVGKLNELVEEITKEYLEETQKRGQEALCKEHFQTILTSLSSGGGDHCMAALDSCYYKHCLETFKLIRRLIELVTWGKRELFEELSKESMEVEQFLRKEFPHHLRELSLCCMHSFEHAFARTAQDYATAPPEAVRRV